MLLYGGIFFIQGPQMKNPLNLNLVPAARLTIWAFSEMSYIGWILKFYIFLKYDPLCLEDDGFSLIT